MITFKEAEKIAFSKASGMNVCNEYEKAYHFFSKDIDTDGGFYDIVVMKEDGRTLTFTQFIQNYLPEKNPKRIELEYVETCGDIPMIGIMDDGWSEEIRRALESLGDNDD